MNFQQWNIHWAKKDPEDARSPVLLLLPECQWVMDIRCLEKPWPTTCVCHMHRDMVSDHLYGVFSLSPSIICVIVGGFQAPTIQLSLNCLSPWGFHNGVTLKPGLQFRLWWRTSSPLLKLPYISLKVSSRNASHQKGKPVPPMLKFSLLSKCLLDNHLVAAKLFVQLFIVGDDWREQKRAGLMICQNEWAHDLKYAGSSV